MKILFFGQNPKLPSGMAKVSDNIAKELSKYHEVIYQAQTGAEYGEEYHGYELHGTQSGGEDLGFNSLGQRIAETQPDAVVTNLNWHQLFQLPNVMNQFRGKDHSMPLFLYTAVETEEPVPGMYQYMIENHMNDVYFIPYTEDHYEMWQEDEEMSKFVPDYVPHGIDQSIYQEQDERVARDFYRQMVGLDPEEHTTFLFVGENWRRKRADLMLEAFKQFKEENDADDAKIVLHTSAGPSHGDGLFYTGWEMATGPQSPEPNPLLDSIGLTLGEDVHLTKRGATDKLPEEQMPLLYAGADALVLPTMAEGFGLPLVEAGACGTPAIVTDTGVTREVTGDDALYVDTSQKNFLRKGEVLREPSIESMKQKFEEFYNMDASERERLSQKAMQNASEYSWKNAARKFDDLFEQWQNNELPTKRANEASKIGSDINIDMEELMNE